MATQDEVFNYEEENYRHEMIGALTFTTEGPIDGTRNQMVYTGVADHELQARSPFA